MAVEDIQDDAKQLSDATHYILMSVGGLIVVMISTIGAFMCVTSIVLPKTWA